MINKGGDKIMPWSPLLYEKEILLDILMICQKNNRDFVTINELQAIVMRRTRMTSEKTLKNTLKALETLGYISHRPDGYFDVNKDEIQKRLGVI